MRFAQEVGAVTALTQIVCDRPVLGGIETSGVARELGGHELLREQAHADHVMVAPHQQRCARRRAHGRGVEVRVSQTVVGKPLDRGCACRTTERTAGTEPDVVDQDPQHIRLALGVGSGRCRARLRLGIGLADDRSATLRLRPDAGDTHGPHHDAGNEAGRQDSSPPRQLISRAVIHKVCFLCGSGRPLDSHEVNGLNQRLLPAAPSGPRPADSKYPKVMTTLPSPARHRRGHDPTRDNAESAWTTALPR